MPAHVLHELFADLDRACAASRIGAVQSDERYALGGAAPDPVHLRRVYRAPGDSWVFICTCGYVSLGFLSHLKAETVACPIQVLELESAERRRTLFQG